MLRDRLVCWIDDKRVQRNLLAEPELTFQKAKDRAIAMKTADRNVLDLQKNGEAGLYQETSEKPDMECYRCGGKHPTSECRFKTAECHNCGKRGHIARVCKSKPKHSISQRQGSLKAVKTHLIMEEDEEDTAYTLFTVSRKQAKPLLVTVLVNQTKLPMEEVPIPYQWSHLCELVADIRGTSNKAIRG